MENVMHPSFPESNVAKFRGYEPDKYALVDVSPTQIINESICPMHSPSLTQRSIGKFLVPLTRELSEVPQRPTISELPDAVIDRMVQRDKANWVDKPGINDYTIHDSYNHYGIFTEIVKPTHQDISPRSYQYDLDCVNYRRRHACDGLKQKKSERKKPLSAYCRECRNLTEPVKTHLQQAWTKDPGQKRWKNYPDLTATLTKQEIRASMNDVGRPFQNEACNWYYKNYPPVKYECINRKFSK